MNHPGLFIAFEGPEGAGKTTQVALLVEWLCARTDRILRTREPGATDVGSRIRDLLLMRQPALDIPPRCEALLYAADRAAHVATLIRPALARGRSSSPTGTRTVPSPTRARAARSATPSRSCAGGPPTGSDPT